MLVHYCSLWNKGCSLIIHTILKGILLTMTATTLFMLSMSFAAQGYSWDSPFIIVSLQDPTAAEFGIQHILKLNKAPLVLSCVLIAPLAFVERKVAIEPLFPSRVFTNRSIIFMTIYNAGWGITFITFVYYAPTYFQIVHGDSATQSGIRLIPLEVAACTAAFISTWFISRTGQYRISLSLGVAMMAILSGLFLTFDINTSWASKSWSIFIQAYYLTQILVRDHGSYCFWWFWSGMRYSSIHDCYASICQQRWSWYDMWLACIGPLVILIIHVMKLLHRA